jgi:hypothetical protein
MWYSGNDGTTSRILSAVRPPGSDAWVRLGIAIDPPFSGDSDSFGAESPSVVKTSGGYLMAYGGFDGDVSRLHMASSVDGRHWDPQGTIMQRGLEDEGGANHPCLLVTAERWWLVYTGYEGSGGRWPALVGAVSQTGASWDRLGTLLDLEPGEEGVSHPCVVDVARTFYMLYASEVGGSTRICMATSSDGLAWDRRGTVLAPAGEGPDGLGVHTPCVVKLRDGSIKMWYAGLPVGDQGLGYRVCSASFPGRSL